MKALFILAISIFLSSAAFAQGTGKTEKHTITRDEGFFTTDYTIDGQEASASDVKATLSEVPDAESKWGTANILHYTALGLAFAGGALAGYKAVEGAGQGDVDYKMGLAAGIGMVVVALILDRVSSAKKNGAIELYNSENGRRSFDYPEENDDEDEDEESAFNIQLVPTQCGVGLAFNF